MRAKTVYRQSLEQISPLTLPCLLLLQDDKTEGICATLLFAPNAARNDRPAFLAVGELLVADRVE
nr:hypothetical protein [Sphaerotilus sp.]